MAHRRQQQQQQQRAEETKRMVTRCMIRLSDRDTEPMAIAELESLARSLPAECLSPFLSALADIRPTDKTPLRLHSLRLLSLLSLSHPLRAHLPKLSSILLPRLRDPDSSVRSACVHAVRSLSLSSPSDLPLALLPLLSDSLLRDPLPFSQSSAALCLSAAIDSSVPPDPDLVGHLHRLLPRLLKLARSNAFKAKPALVSLLGSVAAAGGARSDDSSISSSLLSCLLDFLLSSDWAARKSAAEALTRIALAERHLLAPHRAHCLAKFESCRFDKVKIVRDAMNKMLETWKDLSGVDDNAVDVSSNSRRESTSSTASAPTKSKTPTARKKSLPKMDSDSKVEIVEEKVSRGKEGNGRSRFEVKKILFEEEKGGKLKSRVVPFEGSGSSEISSASDKGAEDHRGGVKDGDLSLIQKQLVQIENQQSSLLDLLQKFMGSSQNGIRSLETRVHGLEMTLDEISRDLAVSSGRLSNMSNNLDPEVKICCSLPGAEFLSSRFRRREGGRYSLSTNSTASGMLFMADKQGGDSYRQRAGLQGGFVVNPLAEINTRSRGTEITSKKMLKSVVVHDTGIKMAQDR